MELDISTLYEGQGCVNEGLDVSCHNVRIIGSPCRQVSPTDPIKRVTMAGFVFADVKNLLKWACLKTAFSGLEVY